MSVQEGRTDINVLLKRPTFLLIAGAVFAVSLIAANVAGRQAASSDIERLETVWPFLNRLNDSDRAFLAGLAITCKLHRHASTRNEVVSCLRLAAANPDALLPNTVSHTDAQNKLERMLDYAPGGTGAGS